MTYLLQLASEAETNGAWLPADLNEVYWGTAAFLIIVFLLWKFARKPVADGLAKRQANIAAALEEAEQARRDAEAERDRIKAALANSDAEAARLIEEARQAADRLRADVAARAESDIAALRERAAVDMAATRAQAQADLAHELSRLALGAAEEVVTSSLDEDAQQRLIDSYISQVGSQN